MSSILRCYHRLFNSLHVFTHHTWNNSRWSRTAKSSEPSSVLLVHNTHTRQSIYNQNIKQYANLYKHSNNIKILKSYLYSTVEETIILPGRIQQTLGAGEDHRITWRTLWWRMRRRRRATAHQFHRHCQTNVFNLLLYWWIVGCLHFLHLQQNTKYIKLFIEYWLIDS